MILEEAPLHAAKKVLRERMGIKVKISCKRKWEENGLTCIECYCNGVRIAEGFKSPEREAFAWEAIKNVCKAMKLFGTITDNERLRSIVNRKGNALKIRECELPEWDE